MRCMRSSAYHSRISRLRISLSALRSAIQFLLLRASSLLFRDLTLQRDFERRFRFRAHFVHGMIGLQFNQHQTVAAPFFTSNTQRSVMIRFDDAYAR